MRGLRGNDRTLRVCPAPALLGTVFGRRRNLLYTLARIAGPEGLRPAAAKRRRRFAGGDPSLRTTETFSDFLGGTR